MFGALYAAAADEVASLKRRILRLAAGAVLGTAASVVVLVLALRALLIWLSELYGPVAANLIVAGAALVVAVVAFAIAAIGRSRKQRVARAARQARHEAAGAARDVKLHAFHAARAAGEKVSDTLAGRTGPLNSRKGLTNAVLGAIVIGILLGRRA